MNTKSETSLTKAADPVSVFMSSNCSRHSGSVAFNGLEKGTGMHLLSFGGSLTANPNYPVSDPQVPATSEAQDSSPVAGGTDLFEMMGLMYVAEGKISEDRFNKAMDAVRQGVTRA